MATKRIYNMGTRATEFSKLIQSMTGKHQLWEIWADFVTMAACCISNSVDSGNRERREDLYNRTAGKYEQDEINNMGSLLGLVTLALEEDPEQDFLGEMYMQLELGSHWHGQFFTPYNVSQMMAKISVDRNTLLDKLEYSTAKFTDCACGGGAMLIAAANAVKKALVDTGYNWQDKCLFVGQDLDGIAAKMCYIQLSLLGCAGFVKIGDTLRYPVAAGDDPADYWFTPIFFSDVWVMRRKFRAMDRILNSEIQRGAADEKKETGRGAEDVSDGTVPADEQAESRLQIRFDELGG